MGTNGKENFGGEIHSNGRKKLKKNGTPFLAADSLPDRIRRYIYQAR